MERIALVAGQKLGHFTPRDIIGKCFLLVLGGFHCERDVKAGKQIPASRRSRSQRYLEIIKHGGLI